MTVGDRGADTFLFVRVIAGEGGHGCWDLVEQSGGLEVVVDLLRCQGWRNDLPSLELQAEVCKSAVGLDADQRHNALSTPILSGSDISAD